MNKIANWFIGVILVLLFMVSLVLQYLDGRIDVLERDRIEQSK